MDVSRNGMMLDVSQAWTCPSCARQHQTTGAVSQVPLHQCPNHAGAWVPFVAEGVAAVHRINERQDYLGSDTATPDQNGRIIQSVTTEREDGEDCHVFATTVNLDINT